MRRVHTALLLSSLLALGLTGVGCGGSGSEDGISQADFERFCGIFEDCFGAVAGAQCLQDDPNESGTCNPSRAELDRCFAAMEAERDSNVNACQNLDQVVMDECPCDDDSGPDPGGSACADLLICCTTIGANGNIPLATQCSTDLFDASGNESVCQAELDNTYAASCP